MALTALQVKTAKTTDKPIKLSDGGGLFLLVQPNGSKYWRLAYRFAGKQKTLAVGVYPDVSLLNARDRREDARKQLAAGVDPGENKKAQKAAKQGKAANSFEVVAQEWIEKFSTNKAASTIEKTNFILRRDVFPWLGARPIDEIKPSDLLTVLQRIETRGALETAHRAKQYVGQIFRYAVGTQRAERDITQDLKGALPTPNVIHRAAITEPIKFGALIRSIDGFAGTLAVKCAMKLAPLIFVRPGELRQTEWAWVDMDSAIICYPASVMKMREDHIVPLPLQALAILREIQQLTGSGKYVFPSIRTSARPMSEAAINAALRRIGYSKEEMTGHGFRAAARTIMDEVLGIRVELIEHQLAHAVKDQNGRAYNRTTHLPERKKMMQQWADYLDKLKAGAEIVPLHGNTA